MQQHPAEQPLLLAGRWLPITASVIFVHADPLRCVELVEARTRAATVERFGQPKRVREVRGAGLEAMLPELLPLRLEEDRRLVVRTEHPEWSAMFVNRFRGADQFAAPVLAMWGLRALAVTELPHSWDRRTRRGFGGDRTFQLVEPWPAREVGGRTVDWISHLVTTRFGDDGWAFQAGSGYVDEGLDVAFPVGTVWDASARLAADRFTHEHLVAACARLGLRPFDADFYAPDGSGLVLERSDPQAQTEAALTLAQARGDEPLPAPLR
ncbi:hypothetical protein [Cellulomonas triticagri]|uniref:hypothetical protein n=1 Tax=Cellulomonas triticagri TaxID=2483352 RepID=UPI00131577A9|nr:hypothetical protein [Cellulomonas triticagri]